MRSAMLKSMSVQCYVCFAKVSQRVASLVADPRTDGRGWSNHAPDGQTEQRRIPGRFDPAIGNRHQWRWEYGDGFILVSTSGGHDVNFVLQLVSVHIANVTNNSIEKFRCNFSKFILTSLISQSILIRTYIVIPKIFNTIVHLIQ